MPINTFLLKVAARCNLDCTYCYEFNSADSSWRHKPATMSRRTLDLAVGRVREHAASNGLASVLILFHGGEPLLAGLEFFQYALQKITEELSSTCAVQFGLQTNGTLFSEEYAALFRQFDVRVGLSVDGDRKANDRYRLDHQSRSSFDSTVRGLELISRPENQKIRGGLLSVIDLSNDPVATFEWLLQWHPPQVDFLLPHFNNGRPPTSPRDSQSGYGYGAWLCQVFDYWWSRDLHTVKIRMFEDIMHLCVGGRHSVEALGLSPVRLLVIQSDGAYEAVDSLKSTFDGAVATGMSVETHCVDSALGAHLVSSRLDRPNHLAAECRACELVRVCGGGYIPHRWHPTRGFLAPSVFCLDLETIIRKIAGAMSQTAPQLGPTISSQLMPLTAAHAT